MDGRIVGITETLVRKVYKLSPAYEPVQCNVKRGTVQMEMSNGLISIMVKMPRDIVEAVLDGSEVEHMFNERPPEDEEEQEEQEDGQEEEQEEVQEEIKEEPPKSKGRRIIRHGKNKEKNN